MRILGSWLPCEGGGPRREVSCGACGAVDFEWKSCMHTANDLGCLVYKKEQAQK